MKAKPVKDSEIKASASFVLSCKHLILVCVIPELFDNCCNPTGGRGLCKCSDAEWGDGADEGNTRQTLTVTLVLISAKLQFACRLQMVLFHSRSVRNYIFTL